VMNAGLYDDAKVMSSVWSNAPLVTPKGKFTNVGTWVATPALAPGGAAAWM